MNKQRTLIFSLSAILFIALAFIVYSWTEPAEMPSSYSVPLNTGIEPQGKAGKLLITELHDFQNQDYYLNLTGDSIVAGTISASNPTENEHLATKEYVDNNAGGSPAITKYFGSGIDGDVIITGNTTLNKDMEYRNLTINSGATLNPNGWRVFVSGTLTINSGGKISRDGNNASQIEYIYDAGNYQWKWHPSYGGSGLIANRVGGSASGALGIFKYWDHGLPGENGEFGIGGNGGGGCGGTGGGTGGYGENLNIVLEEYIAPPSQSHLALLPDLTLAQLGGAGGGSGSANTGGLCQGNCHIGGGGGGGGGGIIHIFTKNLVNNGTISARGGNGGNGTYSYEMTYSGGGGGGGGGGGYILLVYNTKSGTGTIDISGGEGGLGTNNPNGDCIFNDGQDGGPGVISEYQVDF